jgi:hypothetical protein
LSLPPAQLWPFPAADAKEWSRADRQTLVRAFTEAPSKPTEVLPNNPCMPIPVPMEATVPKSFSAWCDEMKLNANESKVLTEAFEETGSTILCPETLCLDKQNGTGSGSESGSGSGSRQHRKQRKEATNQSARGVQNGWVLRRANVP